MPFLRAALNPIANLDPAQTKVKRNRAIAESFMCADHLCFLCPSGGNNGPAAVTHLRSMSVEPSSAKLAVDVGPPSMHGLEFSLSASDRLALGVLQTNYRSNSGEPQRYNRRSLSADLL